MSTSTRSRTREAKVRPVHEVRLGRIRAAIWENNTETGIRHNVTITRLYKEGNDWKDSASFGRDDLPLLAKVADLAHTWIFGHMSEKNGSSQNGNGHDEFAEEGARF